jgi:tetratricopeptide (TPR) repeat protein
MRIWSDRKKRYRGALLCLVAVYALGCSMALPPLGKAGKYRTGRALLIQPKGTGVGQAIPILQELAREDPFYEDILTLLGRAYYHQTSYREALELLQRALLVNKEDEIAWLVLGLAQLRLGDNDAGFENLKAGVALLNKVSKNGYRRYIRWDINGLVRSAIRRTVVLATKDGLAAKDDLIRSGELILQRMDDEEASQEVEARRGRAWADPVKK